MGIIATLAGIVLALITIGYTWWRERNYKPGNPPLIPLIYFQYTALIVFIVLAAHLFSSVTGITWDPPLSRL